MMTIEVLVAAISLRDACVAGDEPDVRAVITLSTWMRKTRRASKRMCRESCAHT
jgi:hypothetical protein